MLLAGKKSSNSQIFSQHFDFEFLQLFWCQRAVGSHGQEVLTAQLSANPGVYLIESVEVRQLVGSASAPACNRLGQKDLGSVEFGWRLA